MCIFQQGRVGLIIAVCGLGPGGGGGGGTWTGVYQVVKYHSKVRIPDRVSCRRAGGWG